MASEKRDDFPCIPEKSWWLLRQKFKESIPEELSRFYVSNILNISPQSAWDTVILQMRMIGLIDERGKPTDLAIRWKDDKKYNRVCTQIIKNIYPAELTQLFPSAMAPAPVVAKWFKDICLCEGSLGQRCAEFYLMLLDGDPGRAKKVLGDPDKPFGGKIPQPTSPDEAPVNLKAPGKDLWQSSAGKMGRQSEKPSGQAPAIHIDFHIHINPETTPDKVDEIFKQVAKHLATFQKE
jgi:hypothetical protein